jgi:hypothetical protein
MLISPVFIAEGVENSRRISLKPVFSLVDAFGMVFTFYTIFQANLIR